MKNILVKHTSFLFLLLLFSAGCKVTFIPDYDKDIAAQIDNTAKMVDRFYLEMLETPDGDYLRAYNFYSEEYINIEVELNSLLYKNKVRPLNENSVRICEITLQLWIKYKEEHKQDDKLSNGLIKLNRVSFADLFFAMQSAEKAKEIIINPPQ
ncbi:MAG: hypothetical protein H7Y00_00630 [Fimbriimonadaceae bacterium]|nr:hypothetical protein [Chitinophagales bacterium]